MKDFKAVFLLLTGLFGLPCLLQPQTITQDEFLDQLKQRHPLFEKEKLTAEIEKKEQNSYLGAEDWNIFSSVNLSHEEPDIALAGPERTDALSISGGIERLFWETGGRLSASFSSSWADIKLDPVYGFPNSFYQNKIELTYTHPLLRNKNGFLDRLQYELKGYDIDFSEVQALENQEDFLANSAAKFLDWVFLTEQEMIVTERLKLAEEELTRTKKKREAYLVDEVDVTRAEYAVRIAKQNLVLVASQGKALQAELAVLSQNNEIYNFNPEFNLYRVEELTPLEEAVSELKDNSRLIQALHIRLKQLEYARQGFEDTMKPDLSILAQVNTKNLDSSLFDSFVMDKPDAIVGLQFNTPLEKRTVRSQISRTELQIAQLEKQIDEIILGLVSALTNIHIQIKELEKVLQLNQEQIESAKKRTEEELKLYNQGRGDLTFVLQSRDNEENAKLTYAGNALTYHKLFIEYRALTDLLL